MNTYGKLCSNKLSALTIANERWQVRTFQMWRIVTWYVDMYIDGFRMFLSLSNASKMPCLSGSYWAAQRTWGLVLRVLQGLTSFRLFRFNVARRCVQPPRPMPHNWRSKTRPVARRPRAFRLFAVGFRWVHKASQAFCMFANRFLPRVEVSPLCRRCARLKPCFRVICKAGVQPVERFSPRIPVKVICMLKPTEVNEDWF